MSPKYLGKLFYVSQNFAVIQQYKKKTGSSKIFKVFICLFGTYNL